MTWWRRRRRDDETLHWLMMCGRCGSTPATPVMSGRTFPDGHWMLFEAVCRSCAAELGIELPDDPPPRGTR